MMPRSLAGMARHRTTSSEWNDPPNTGRPVTLCLCKGARASLRCRRRDAGTATPVADSRATRGPSIPESWFCLVERRIGGSDGARYIPVAHSRALRSCRGSNGFRSCLGVAAAQRGISPGLYRVRRGRRRPPFAREADARTLGVAVSRPIRPMIDLRSSGRRSKTRAQCCWRRPRMG